MTLRRAGTLVAVLVVLVAGAVAGWQTWRLAALERERRLERIAQANQLAAKDSSLLELRTEADSQIAVAQRLAFQTVVELREAFRDSVQRVAQAAARFALEADSLRATLRGERAERDSAGAITVAGALDATDSLGVAVTARVTVPPDLILPRWDWRIRRAAIPLELALSCEETRAVAQLAGPPWARLRLDSVAQRPEFCNPLPHRRWTPIRLEIPSLSEAGAVIAVWELGRWLVRTITNRP